MHVGIFGDSWGCGEWGGRHTSNYGIRHRGLAQYLIESRIKCRQFSVPDGSNYLAIERYEENYKTLDYAIFILTEPFRDFLHGRKYNPKKGFLENCKIAEIVILDQLTHIQKNKTKVILVNGLFELEKQSYFEDHISFCKLVSDQKIWPKYYADPGHVNDLFLKKKQIKIDKHSVVFDLDQDEKNQKMFLDLMNNDKKRFFPDGRHPNRTAHKILAEKIIRIININGH